MSLLIVEGGGYWIETDETIGSNNKPIRNLWIIMKYLLSGMMFYLMG